jgi:hypothetical protein
MPDAFRVDRKAFRAAFTEPMQRAAWIPTSSGAIPALGSHLGHWVATAVKSRRKVYDETRKYLATRLQWDYLSQDSWNSDHHNAWDVDLPEYFSSEEMENLADMLGEVFKLDRNLDLTIACLPKGARLRSIQMMLLARQLF